MELLYTIFGLLMFAGNIFCSVYVFGGAKDSPKWLLMIAGILNIFLLVSVFGLASGS